ncbi:pectate lyase [Micromonospora sp. C28SCA-DRY-2]|uniref:pectate lyase family protein n=1 Tax=Micromonospora sp. C28SCA-DRY-2 TaxID=3059522 RepID=UPI0026770437|nr:right-handed parallel beta-helix repeat-containing protein [Micromonospora sp. C28SCA-DRY-2]MDO3705185.1 pectate lyase [Micromonospora sp. C28SCA-DRY-2]
MRSRHLPRGALTAAGAGLTALLLAVGVTTGAHAATLFADSFDDGTADGWSKSGGDWTVVTDGTPAYRQGNAGSELARAFAGQTGWTDYQVQARVKPLSFSGTNRIVGLAARVESSTRMYRLALTNAGRAELQVVNGSSITPLGSIPLAVGTGTWYTLRIEADGGTVRGFVDGTPVGAGAGTAYDAGRIALVTAYASAVFDDVRVDGAGGTPPTTTPPTTTPPTSTPPTTAPPTTPPPTTPPAGLVGWATRNGGTTGGAGGATVTVTDATALANAVKGDTPTTVRVSGRFGCSTEIRSGSNKTIVGVGAASGLTGCGLNLRDVRNVIVRNLTIAKVPAGVGNGDAIHLDNASNVWIDHNDLSSDTTSGTDHYDGLLDITHGSDYVTVSWNRLHDHVKCSLVGHSDGNSGEDAGRLRVTYHHNLFGNCFQRNPRVRYGNPVHVFNNYYVNTANPSYSYGIASTSGAGVLVEGNFFENMTDPTHVGEGSSPGGALVARDNHFVNSGVPQTAGSVAAVPYPYALEPAAGVKATVTAGAGTGRVTG